MSALMRMPRNPILAAFLSLSLSLSRCLFCTLGVFLFRILLLLFFFPSFTCSISTQTVPRSFQPFARLIFKGWFFSPKLRVCLLFVRTPPKCFTILLFFAFLLSMTKSRVLHVGNKIFFSDCVNLRNFERKSTGKEKQTNSDGRIIRLFFGQLSSRSVQFVLFASLVRFAGD